MRRYLGPIAVFLIIVGFILVLGCAGASDCGRPIPWPTFWGGAACMVVAFILSRFVVE